MTTFFDNFLRFVGQLLPGKKPSTSKLDVISRSALNRRKGILFEYVTSKSVNCDTIEAKEIRAALLSEAEYVWARDVLQKEQLTVADVIESFSQTIPGVVEVLAFRIERVKCDNNFIFLVFPLLFPKRIHLIFHIDPILFDETPRFIEL